MENCFITVSIGCAERPVAIADMVADELKSCRSDFKLWLGTVSLEGDPLFISSVNNVSVGDFDLLALGFAAGEKTNKSNFCNAVAEMRRLQREYFRTRDSCHLRDAKKAESIVDGMLHEYDRVEQKRVQPDLLNLQG
jgi:hypothetical protein